MTAKIWTNIYDLVVPFKNTKLFNITSNLHTNNYTTIKIFKQAEKFFISLGLYPMTDAFWKYSVFTKPLDNDYFQCDESAFDFNNGYDYRIKMCAEVNEEVFFKAHHYMGHIEYFMSYSEQPSIFRVEANTAFNEAIGDTMVLSVNNPTHLKKIGLLQGFLSTREIEVNFLMKIALRKIPSIAFAYIADKWRWSVFRGEITPQNYNKKWWEMIKTYQGIQPPFLRDNESYFDPGGIYKDQNNEIGY